MGPVWHLLLIGISANLDNLGVGMAYGVRRILVPALSNLLIAAIAFVFTFTSLTAGAFIGRFLTVAVANRIGAVLLAGVGVWLLCSQRSPRASEGPDPEKPERRPSGSPPGVLALLEAPEAADVDRSGVISLRESLVLGIALSVNCLANGFTAGLWRLGAVATSLTTAVFSYLCLWAGWSLGRYGAAKWIGDRAGLVAGCLLILLGLHQLF